MLLVRPDGVLSYYHLREALRGLKIDFGYEFIDKDWVLDFPADDQAPTPQSWVTTTKPVDAPPAPAVASGRRVAGIPTPGQDGPPLSSSAPYPPGSSPGLRGALGPPISSGVAAGSAPHGIMPGVPGGTDGTMSGWHKGKLTSFGSGGDGLPGSGSASAPFPSSGVAMNAAPHGVLPGRPEGEAGTGPGSATGVPTANGSVAGGSRSGSAGSSVPLPPPSLFLTPPPERTTSGAGGSSGSASAGSHDAGAAPSSNPSIVLPELGPPRINTGQKPANGTSATADGSGAARRPIRLLGPSNRLIRIYWRRLPKQRAASASTSSAAATASPAPPALAVRLTRLRRRPARLPGPEPAAATAAAIAAMTTRSYARLQPPKLPKGSPRPAPLRPARLSGDRDWIVFVECKTEGVVIYPTHLLIPASVLARTAGSNPLLLMRPAIDRPQAGDGAARRCSVSARGAFPGASRRRTDVSPGLSDAGRPGRAEDGGTS